MVEIFYYPVYLYTLTYKPENGTLAFMNKKLDIVKLDCEERFGLASGGCFAAGRFSSLILGLLFTAIFYAALGLLRMHTSGGIAVEMFFPGGAENRTYIPAITVLLAMIALGKLAIKRSKLSMQKYAGTAGLEEMISKSTKSTEPSFPSSKGVQTETTESFFSVNSANAISASPVTAPLR